MSNYEHKEGFGSLFKNNYKEKENQPDMKGDAMYNGKPVELAAWTKTDKNGNKFLSLKIQDKQEQYQQAGAQQAAAPQQAPGGFINDEIPW